MNQLLAAQIFVPTGPGQELLMATLFNDDTVLQHQNLIRPLHSGQAMGNHQHRASRHGPPEALLHSGLRFRIQGAGGLVQQQHSRVTHHGPGYGQPLPLTT